MRNHGGYYKFVNSLDLTNHNDNQGLPKSAKRIELIIERHKKLILEPRLAEEPLDDSDEEVEERLINFNRTSPNNS